MNLELDIRDIDIMIRYGNGEDVDFESPKQVEEDLGIYSISGKIWADKEGSYKIYVSLDLENTSATDIDKYALVEVKQIVTLSDGRVNYEDIFTREMIQVFARPGCKQELLDYNYTIIPNINQFNVKMTVIWTPGHSN